MRFNTDVVGKMTDHYIELKQYSALTWSGDVDSDKALRYCINLVDPESPIYKITDIENRTTRAAELAGFVKKGKKFSPPVQEMIEGFNENANEMLFVIMGIYHNPIFELWLSSKVSMHNILRSLRTPPRDLDSKKLVEETKTRVAIEKELNSIINEQISREAKIFRDDNIKSKVAGLVTQRYMNYAEQFSEER